MRLVPCVGEGLHNGLKSLQANHNKFLQCGWRSEMLYENILSDMNLMSYVKGDPNRKPDEAANAPLKQFSESLHILADEVHDFIDRLGNASGSDTWFTGPTVEGEVKVLFKKYKNSASQLQLHLRIVATYAAKSPSAPLADEPLADSGRFEVVLDDEVFAPAKEQVNEDDVDEAAMVGAPETMQAVGEFAAALKESAAKAKEQQAECPELGAGEVSELTAAYDAEWQNWQSNNLLAWGDGDSVDVSCPAFTSGWVDRNGNITPTGAKQALQDREGVISGETTYTFSTPIKTRTTEAAPAQLQSTPRQQETAQIATKQQRGGNSAAGKIAISGEPRTVFQTERGKFFYLTPTGNKSYITTKPDKMAAVDWDTGCAPAAASAISPRAAPVKAAAPPTARQLDFQQGGAAKPPQAPLSWNAYRTSIKGQGMTSKEISAGYAAQKA